MNRRTAIEVRLRAMAPWLLVGALLALGCRALGAERAVVASVLAGGAGLGMLRGALAARTPRIQVQVGDAAWALDRLNGHQERALAAALVPAGVAASALSGLGPLPAPPKVGLRPPAGLAPVLGAVLLGALALVAPQGTPEAAPLDTAPQALPTGPGAPATGPDTPGNPGRTQPAPGEATDPGSAAPGESESTQAATKRLAALEAARRALNLAPDGPLDPQVLAERLGNAELRERAVAAAPGTPVADLLAEGDTPSEALAQAMLDLEHRLRAEAEHARREAVRARARRLVPPTPTHRRDVVRRYLERRHLSDRAPTGGSR